MFVSIENELGIHPRPIEEVTLVNVPPHPTYQEGKL
jgi:hypothetical protein